MIQQIITVLDAAASGALTVHERVGLAEMREVNGRMRPTYYVGGTDARHIIEDSNGSVSYWRMTSPYRQTVADASVLSVCGDALKRTYYLRYVVFLDRSDEVCSNLPGALGQVGSALMRASDPIDEALLLLSATVMPTSTEADTVRASGSEFPGGTVPIQKAMAWIDVQVEIQGEPACFDECDPVTVTIGSFCEQVQTSTADRLLACMSDAQIATICGGAVTCGDVTILLTVEGQVEAPFVIDTCEDNTVNISVG